jgi:hypothetical protein
MNINAKNVTGNLNTSYSGVTILYLAPSAKMIVWSGSCLLVASRAAAVFHHPQPPRVAPRAPARIAARVTKYVF